MDLLLAEQAVMPEFYFILKVELKNARLNLARIRCRKKQNFQKLQEMFQIKESQKNPLHDLEVRGSSVSNP